MRNSKHGFGVLGGRSTCIIDIDRKFLYIEFLDSLGFSEQVSCTFYFQLENTLLSRLEKYKAP